MTWYEHGNEADGQVNAQANGSPVRAAAALSLLELDDSQAAPSHPVTTAVPVSLQGEPLNPKAQTACTNQYEKFLASQ